METTIIQAAIYGLIQGLTEFIPVSSSGHLFVIPALLGWQPPSTSLTLFLHIGTLIALVIYFRFRLAGLVQALVLMLRKQKLNHKQEQNVYLIRLVAISTVPTAIIGLAVNNLVTQFYDLNEVPQLPLFITLVAMIFVGVLFIVFAKYNVSKEVDFKNYSLFKGLLIGLAQALAFIRGVSRSGITLLVGQSLGLSRSQAAEYSFLLSIPVLMATSAKSFLDFLNGQLPNIDVTASLVGVIVAGVSGYLAVSFLINYLKTNTLRSFGWYRIIFGLFALLILFS